MVRTFTLQYKIISSLCLRLSPEVKTPNWDQKHCCRYNKENEPPHDKTNKMACAPSQDSEQPWHPPSQIRVFAVRMKKAWVLSYPLSAQRRRYSDWAEMPRLIWVFDRHAVSLLVLSRGGSYGQERWATVVIWHCNWNYRSDELWTNWNIVNWFSRLAGFLKVWFMLKKWKLWGKKKCLTMRTQQAPRFLYLPGINGKVFHVYRSNTIPYSSYGGE